MERVGSDLARTIRYEGPLSAVFNLASPRFVAIGIVVGNACTTRFREEGSAESDQSTGRDLKLHAHPVRPGIIHGHHLAFTCGHQLCDRTLMFGRNINHHVLIRLVQDTVNGLGHHLRLTHGEFKTLAAHGLHQH